MKTAQQSVHPIPGKVRRGHDGGSLRVFKRFLWLEAGPVKVALSRPTHQRVTHTVRCFAEKQNQAQGQVLL